MVNDPNRSDSSGFWAKWFNFGRNRYAIAATITTAISVVSTTSVALLFIVDAPTIWRVAAVAVGIIASIATWAFKNRKEFETESREQADTEGLIATLDNVLAQLPDAAAANPDDATARLYVEKVIEGLRARLAPEGKRGVVRVCVFRRDEQEALIGRDGEEEQEQDQEGGVVSEFVSYVSCGDQRTDGPRPRFTDAEDPGMTFMPELFEHGRFAASTPDDFPPDHNHYQAGRSPSYSSFVNLALRDRDGKAHAMLTCDATEEDFFDARREQMIRAFSRLVDLALTRGSTRAEVNRPSGV